MTDPDPSSWTPFDALAAEPVRAPRSIVERVLAYVRELAGETGTALLTCDEGAEGLVGGSSSLTARAVVRCARLAAQEVDGVRLVLCRPAVPSSGPPSEAPDDAPAAVAVAVTVAAEQGQDLHALADRIRLRVVAEVQTLTGPRPVSVSVHVDDVFPALRR